MNTKWHFIAVSSSGSAIYSYVDVDLDIRDVIEAVSTPLPHLLRWKPYFPTTGRLDCYRCGCSWVLLGYNLQAWRSKRLRRRHTTTRLY